MDEINSDLTGQTEALPTPAQNVEIPQSSAPVFSPDLTPTGGESEGMFADDPQPQNPLFDEDVENLNPTIPGEKRPIARAVLGLALSPPSSAPEGLLAAKETLKMAETLLDNAQDSNARLDMALKRQKDTAVFLQGYIRDRQSAPKGVFSDETNRLVQDAYQSTLQRNVERDSKISAELEAIDRINDSMLTGDYTEAYMVRDLYLNGDAHERWYNEKTKDLLEMQFLERAEARYEDSGWMRGFFNGLLRATPLTYLSDINNLVRESGIGFENPSWLEFFFAGDNLANQYEYIRDMDPEAYAEYLAENGPLDQALKNSAGFSPMDDPAAQRDVAASLFGIQDPTTKEFAGFFGAVDVASAIPIGTTMSLVRRMGARKAASDLLVAALKSGSPAEVRAVTGATVLDVADEVLPGSARLEGVSGGADAIAAIRVSEELEKTFPELMEVSKYTDPDEVLAAYQAAEKEAMERYGSHVKDTRFIEVDVKTNTAGKWSGEISEEGAKVREVEVTVGKKDGGGYAKAETAKNTAVNKFSIDPSSVEIVEDSGQFFAKFRIPVPEEGFVTRELQSSDRNPILNWFRSTANIADPIAKNKALVGENAGSLFQEAVITAVKTVFKGVPKVERNAVSQILAKGMNQSKWFSRDELAVEFEKQTGMKLTQKAEELYNTYKNLSDLGYGLRNRNVYLEKHRQGFQSLRFTMAGRTVDLDGVINYTPTKKPAGGVYDALHNRFIDPKFTTPDDIKAMADDGYVLVKLDHDFALPDGRLIRNAFVKKTDLEIRPLRYQQLNYVPGGSRAYTATNFAKQARLDKEGNLFTPYTFIAGNNPNEMKAWADTMNDAIDLYNKTEGKPDLIFLEDILSRSKGAPSAEEFMEMVNTNAISTKAKIQIVKDKGLPVEYFNKSDDDLRFVNLEDTDIQSYHHSMGRMYYSKRGEALKDYTGDFAETVDPWEGLNASLTEITRTTSFSGYKQSMLERFEANYKDYLTLRNAPSLNLYEYATAEIRQGVTDSRIINQIKSEQASIRRILNFETGYEKTINQMWNNLADWALGKGMSGSLREKASDSIHWMRDNNPVRAVRKLAFDMNLGLFNPNQLLVQSSTMASAWALAGNEIGSRAAFGTMPFLYWGLKGYSDNALDAIAKSGAWKGLYESEGEFKEFMKFYHKSGIHNVGGDKLAQLRDYGPTRLFGAASEVDAAREKGRFLFYKAEQMNRATAAGIAWRKLKEKGLKPGTAQFREEFTGLVDSYSFHMMGSASAGFQHGLASIPTQFWAYSFRMAEAFLGKEFTPQQKARLMMANLALAGAAGVPFGTAVVNGYQEFAGEPLSFDSETSDPNYWMSWLERGVIDGLINATTEADVRIGEKIGTMDLIPNTVLDWFNAGEYGDKSFAQVALGASGSKVGSTVPVLWDAIKYSAMSAAGYETGNIPSDAWLRVAREIQSANFAYAGYQAAAYGTFFSKNGTLVDSDLPDADAFFIGLGFNPSGAKESAFYLRAGKEQKEAAKEGAKLISKWRQEAFTNPDKFQENAENEAAFLSMQPPHMRARMLDEAYQIKDKSLLESVKRRFEAETKENKFIDEIVPQIEETAKEAE